MTVAFKNDTKENQAARIKAQQEKHAKMVTDAGYTNPQEIHGYVSAFMVKNTITAKNGKQGKHYIVNIYADGKDNFFHIFTYAAGMMKRYDRMVELKNADKALKLRKLTGTVIFGDNPYSKRKDAKGVAAVFLDQKKIDEVEAAMKNQQPAQPAPQAAPQVTQQPQAAQAVVPSVDDADLPF